MIEHIVLIKFSPNTTIEQKEELINRTLKSKEIIPGILDIQQGINYKCPYQNVHFCLSKHVHFRLNWASLYMCMNNYNLTWRPLLA